MKRFVGVILISALLSVLLCTSAYAVDAPASGVYDLSVTSGYQLTPLTAEGATITGASATIDGKSVTFFSQAEKFTLSYSADNAVDYHLVLMLRGSSAVPTAGNIVYIDQTSAKSEGTTYSVTFTIFPMTMSNGEYYVYLSNSSGTSLIKAASMKFYQPYTLGDVNGDGIITASDALLVLNHVAENIKLTHDYEVRTGVKYDALSAAEVTKDSSLTASDALRILNYVAENITSFD